MVENSSPELQSRNRGDVLGHTYKLPSTDAFFPKPRQFMISKNKDRNHLAGYATDKKMVPGPTQYNVGLNLLFKKNLSIYKKQRYYNIISHQCFLGLRSVTI